MKRRRDIIASTAMMHTTSQQMESDDILEKLAITAQENLAEGIGLLVAQGVDLSAPCTRGLSALHQAVLAGSTDTALALLRAGSDVEAVDVDSGRTPLHFAALKSSTEIIRVLLGAGANIAARDADGRNVLHLACVVRAEVDVVLHLIKAGADPLTADARGWTPLHVAVRSGWAAVVRAIVSTGARPDLRTSRLLREAVRAGDADVVTALIEGGWETTGTDEALAGDGLGMANPADEKCGGDAYTPLMLAADSGRPEVVRALLKGEHKGFPNHADKRGYTALHLATMRGSACIAEILLREGEANGDAMNADGDTALHVAVATRRTNVGEVILRAGATVDIPNRKGHTALHYAAALGLADFAQQLIRRGADIHAMDGVELTPPMKVAATAMSMNLDQKKASGQSKTSERPSFIRSSTCITMNCDDGIGESARGVSAQDGDTWVSTSRHFRCTSHEESSLPPRRQGKTPLHFAASNGQVETAFVLLQAGATAAHRENQRRESPLFVAARRGHAEVVELLQKELELEDVDAPVSSGDTPLSAAVDRGHADVVDKLLRKNASLETSGPDSRLPILSRAAACTSPTNRLRIVRALLDAGADPNAGGGIESVCTPLHTACGVPDAGTGSAVVQALLKAGAKVESEVCCAGWKSLRPLHIAAANGNAPAVRALTIKGCCLDAETSDPSRSTPLVLAVQGGQLEACRELISAGADIHALPRGEDGIQLSSSLARLAATMKRNDIVALFAEAIFRRDSAECWTREWSSGVVWPAGSAGRATWERPHD